MDSYNVGGDSYVFVPFNYYAICNNQVIATYHCLDDFVENVNCLYGDLIEKYGVQIIDNNRICVAQLGTMTYIVNDALFFTESADIEGFIVPEDFAELIYFDNPQNAIFSLKTSSNIHLHTDSRAYIYPGNFTPPFPTITNWSMAYWKNYFQQCDSDAQTLQFLAKTDKDILYPRIPVNVILQFQPELARIIIPIYGSWYKDTWKLISITKSNILDLARGEFDVSELSSMIGDTNWYFSNFKLINNPIAVSYTQTTTDQNTYFTFLTEGKTELTVTVNGINYKVLCDKIGYMTIPVTTINSLAITGNQ